MNMCSEHLYLYHWRVPVAMVDDTGPSALGLQVEEVQTVDVEGIDQNFAQ